jgi:hypothetical protein
MNTSALPATRPRWATTHPEWRGRPLLPYNAYEQADAGEEQELGDQAPDFRELDALQSLRCLVVTGDSSTTAAGGRRWQCTSLSTFSGGTSSRVAPSWPGCPPGRRLRFPACGAFRLGSTQGGSLEGGFDELVELVLSFSSSSATRARSSAFSRRSSAFSALRASIASKTCCSVRSSFLLWREISPLGSSRSPRQASCTWFSRRVSRPQAPQPSSDVPDLRSLGTQSTP